ncbi:MBL fold metallo-hydrolase [Methylotuvimicrobium sp. KM1]|uniref:MBL fold metallo-hydrolase n=1 Tax=Methylotuvimicrobium sp. KM1 TaxID=3377707 RepID=UPI00384A9078
MNGIHSLAPAKNEIEVTLLGPGYGESVVIHIGGNKWVIIDSCIDIDSKKCSPLEYLKSINVDPNNIVLIIASHWHDDHVKGLSELVKVSKNAKFCCSTALTSDEFIANVTRFEENNPYVFSSGVEEYKKILTELATKEANPIRAITNRRIYQSKPEDAHNCEIWSLSPSDKEIDLFLQEIKNIIPIEHEYSRRMSVTRNNVSVVVHIKIEDHIFLLGSDLEETKDQQTGWSVIVESNEKPLAKANVFKIPHHGSITGHSDAVWNEMIEKNAYSILTPYNKGRKLPSQLDVNRIVSFCENAYSTVKNLSVKRKKRTPTVEKMIKKNIMDLRSIRCSTGRIRIRRTIGSNRDWQIELFNEACKLKDMICSR